MRVVSRRGRNYRNRRRLRLSRYKARMDYLFKMWSGMSLQVGVPSYAGHVETVYIVYK
jgi:hypothetical protein